MLVVTDLVVKHHVQQLYASYTKMEGVILYICTSLLNAKIMQGTKYQLVFVLYVTRTLCKYTEVKQNQIAQILKRSKRARVV